MRQERLLQIIIAPYVSEKTARVGELHRQYAFKVLPDAKKPEIRAAVEKLFQVTVTGVNVSIVKGKRKMTGRIPGRRSDWKKAYVTLQEGQEINFAGT